ncbi:hypothetical protein SETIT_5G102800v2 [Setaria italica]|uniref:Uncharacterized protein n=1 Tax=Setaria italica TaxID=4555 RepID=A0A368R377_SETIT|nr:hypothetical protein SETIT_5G102800v2 [Setaria italica]
MARNQWVQLQWPDRPPPRPSLSPESANREPGAARQNPTSRITPSTPARQIPRREAPRGGLEPIRPAALLG